MPDITVGPLCMFTFNKTPGSIIDKFFICRIRVSAVVAAAQLLILLLCIPRPALVSLSCHAHLAFVGSSIIFVAVNVSQPPICNTAVGLK